MKKSKKLALIYIFDLLKRHTDEDHPLTIQEIERMMETMDEYDLDMERKAVSRNVRMLIDEGVVESYGGKRGCFFSDRQFEPSELRLLIHSVLCNPSVPKEYTRDLVDRLMDLGGTYFDPGIDVMRMSDDWNKTDNKEIFLNLDLITQAVRSAKMVEFEYHRYEADMKMHKSSDHIASPYLYFMRNQTYYMVAFSETYKDLVFYRLDHIKNMKVLDKKKRPLKSIPGYEGEIDLKYISGNLPYMYSDKPETIVLKAKRSAIDQIVSKFGKDLIIQEDGKDSSMVTVAIKSSPQAMEYWAKQNLDQVEVVTPIALREKIRASLEEGLKKYSSDGAKKSQSKTQTKTQTKRQTKTESESQMKTEKKTQTKKR